MVYAQPRIHLRIRDADRVIVKNKTKNKQENLPNIGFCRRGVKLKESKKRDKYLDVARELRKLWSMKVTVIPFIIDVLGTVTEGLVQRLEDVGIRGRMETFQTTELLNRPEYREESERLEENCCHSDSSEKPTCVKNSQKKKIVWMGWVNK